MSPPTLIILAAGRARRYGNIKPLAPVGPDGATIIDLLASDALDAGFEHIVVVVNPDTGPVIQEHIEERWPAWVRVSFAVQAVPDGTTNAILAARDLVDLGASFAVANADDLYGREALLVLGAQLSTTQRSCLVGFLLANAVIGQDPVSRGMCQVEDGRLTAITERRKVRRTTTGFVAEDGLAPERLDGDELVSMNLWGFGAQVWDVLADARDSTFSSEEHELLLPEVVGRAVDAGQLDVDVVVSTGRCVGVTHPGDLEMVQADIRAQIAAGQRPAALFGGHHLPAGR